jgi:CDP-paratose 2-epimerase
MKPVLVTGGAGFIGTNLAHRLLSNGRPVLILDSLARPGVEQNLRWLRDVHGDGLSVEVADVRDAAVVRRAVERAGQIFHFAAQVAVTTSLGDPLDDFEVNARGTFNLLEAIRAQPVPPPLVYTSTNKVYGALEDVSLRRRTLSYEPLEPEVAARGVSELRPLDFHSPYGCSKGCADQYVHDYARSYGLRTIVFRMSCIYGPHQHGTEDQGWVAHFLIKAFKGEPIVLYGDGMQVRDILFIDDLVNAFMLARDNISTLAGSAFNIGGGVEKTTSLMELLDRIADLRGKRISLTFEDWRTGDQRYYVSNTAKFREATGWTPKVGVDEGVERLYEWVTSAGLVHGDLSDAAHAPDAHSRRVAASSSSDSSSVFPA